MTGDGDRGARRWGPGAVVLRWGHSAYETTADLQRERDDAEALGLAWAHVPRGRPSPAALAAAAALVVTSGVRVDAEILAALGGDLVVTTTSGHDHIDVAAAAARGVTVARCPKARCGPVAEVAVASLVVLLRRVDALVERASRGVWARAELPALAPRGLAGAVVVVVGAGVIGQRVAGLLDALGADVRVVDPYAPPPGRTPWALDDALVGADAVTLHCALSPSSRGLLHAGRLAALPPHAVVVNTARGDVLDVLAAVDAVRHGRLGGLAVDVFPEEPYPRLAGDSVAGVILTPHSAGYTVGLGARVAAEVRDALAAWGAGDAPAHVVRSDA